MRNPLEPGLPVAGRISAVRLAFAVLLAMVLPTALAGLYEGAQALAVHWRLVEPGTASWLIAATVNSVLAVAVGSLATKGRWPQARHPHPWSLLRERPWRAYLPALLLLGLAVVAAAATRLLAPPPTVEDQGGTPVLWVIWIPLVEEVVFRLGVGGLFSRILTPKAFAAWFSAITFALAHAHPTPERWLDLSVSLPLGPFVLGLAAQLLLQASGRLGPAIALHAAANATVMVFAAMDPRWLSWLQFLYSWSS